MDYELVIADTAYKSKRNERIAEKLNFKFACKPKSRPSNAKPAQVEAEDFELQQVYPFRNRVEGWNGVIKETTRPYMISRPDRKNYPEQTFKEKLEAEKQKDQPELAEILLPEDQAEREKIVLTEQFVGFSPNNEMKCRQVLSLLRALIKAKKYYNQPINLAVNAPFRPRPEDDERSIFRAAPNDMTLL